MGKIISTDIWKKSSRIMTYVSFKNEVSTELMIREAVDAAKQIVIPVIENGRIVPYLIDDVNNSLKPSKFGVPELKPELRTPESRVDKNSIDLIIVPGVAFDLCKNRIGFGAGYYDRFLSDLKAAVPKLAPAFEIQIFDEILVMDHDIHMDLIITEKRVIF
jgi:5-formyltetrahydrofolate cyclo-ligase